MCGPYFNFKDLKQDWDKAAAKISGYHIHIYFNGSENLPDWESSNKAWTIADKLNQLFPNDTSHPHPVDKIGPHTKYNVEVDINRAAFGEALAWLQLNHEGLSILVHPRTGDELKDHENVIWIGQPVAFNQKFLDQFRDPPAQDNVRPLRRKP